MLSRIFFASVLLTAWFVSTAGAAVLEASWCGTVEHPCRIECDHSTNLLYVTSPRTGQIGVFDQNGALRSTIAVTTSPTAIAADGAGHLFVMDGTALRKLSTSGATLMSIGETARYFSNPHDVAVAADGRIYVADEDDSIKVFSATGDFLFRFGGHSYQPGKFDNPVSLAINNTTGEIYVADQNNYRIEAFSLNGTFIRSWGTLGSGLNAPGEFLRPWGVDIDEAGQLWVFDDVLNSVQRFDSTGAFSALYTLPGDNLHGGVDLAVLGNHLYVTEQCTECVLVYRLEDIMPTQLTISYTPQGMMLRWRGAPGALGYQIERSGDLAFRASERQSLGIVTDTFFVDADALSSYNSRYYRVTAVTGSSLLERNPSMPSAEDLPRNTLDDYHDTPHTVDRGVTCTSCHFPRFAYPNPVTDQWVSEHLCASCHVETGAAQPMENHICATDTVFCNTCHSPHAQQASNRHGLIRSVIRTPNSGNRAVQVENATDFIHGAPNYDGICEVCHTATAYHRNNSSGDHNHHAGSNCTDCHTHLHGFAAPEYLRH